VDALALAGGIDLHEVGVAELGRRDGLALETLDVCGILAELRRQQLERDEPLECGSWAL